MSKLLDSINLNRFLSFGNDAESIELRALDLIIGPNGCGKSNFVEAVELLRRIPNEEVLRLPVDWIYKSDPAFSNAAIEVEMEGSNGATLHHRLCIDHFQVEDYRPPAESIELIDDQGSGAGHPDLYRFPLPGKFADKILSSGSPTRTPPG